MKKKGMMLASLFLTAMLCISQSMGVMAYFERGPVNVSLGEYDIVMAVGETRTVSVHFDPGESSQLPGCGMAECPQICGEKDCLDENGECKCNGLDYHTYYAFAKASSSNTDVAAPEYQDGGILQISAISPGTASITVTASLRQFTSTSTEMLVTVTEPAPAPEEPAAGNDPGSSYGPASQVDNGNGRSSGGNGSGIGDVTGGNEGAGAGSDGGSGIEVNQIAGNETAHTGGAATAGTPVASAKSVSGNKKTSSASFNSTKKKSSDTEKNSSGTKKKKQEKKQETAEEEDGIYTIESDRGEIMFIPLKQGKMGKEELEKILGKEIYADFQMKDDADNILYTWEFYGMDLRRAEDLDMTIDVGESPLDEEMYSEASDSLYLAFSHDGALPGKASVYVKVAEYFSDSDVLNFYLYDEEEGIKMAKEGLTVENGYVTLPMSHCSDYILTTDKLADTGGETDSGISVPWIAVIGVMVAAVVVVCAAIVIYKKSRRGKAQ